MTPNTCCQTSGDSYSQTGFNITSAKPSASNPIGNPPLPGWTASGGLNWVGFLASQYNAANPLLTYNFAYGGATTNATLVTPWKPEVLSFIDQVAEFSGSIGAKPRPEYAPWTGEDALVGVWMGVNDVGNSWWKEDYDVLLGQIMDSYFGQLQIVYEAGARNFVLLTVPRESSPLFLPPLFSIHSSMTVRGCAQFVADSQGQKKSNPQDTRRPRQPCRITGGRSRVDQEIQRRHRSAVGDI